MRSGEETLLAAVMHLSHDADPARTCVYAFFFFDYAVKFNSC